MPAARRQAQRRRWSSRGYEAASRSTWWMLPFLPLRITGDALHALLIHRRAMARRQERADDVSGCIERQRVGAALRRHRLHAVQGRRAEHLDGSRLTDRHVETTQP